MFSGQTYRQQEEKTGVKIEVFLLKEAQRGHKLWDVLVEPARKIRIGNKLYFGDDESMVAEVIDNTTSRGRTLRFLYDGPHGNLREALYKLGMTPLPPYIKRESLRRTPRTISVYSLRKRVQWLLLPRSALQPRASETS